MIPIECPKCSRRGNVPQDRLNSRLHCKACNAVFHIDTTGKIMMGEPGSPEKHEKKQKVRKVVEDGPIFDPFEAWEQAPLAAKLGIPLTLLVVLGALYLPNFRGGPVDEHIVRGEAIVRALASGNKSAVTGLATPETAEAAGQWFDLAKARLDKAKLGAGAFPSASLLAGDPIKTDAVTLTASVGDALTNPTEPKFEAFTLRMRRAGRGWLLDGQQTLADARQMASASPGAARGKR